MEGHICLVDFGLCKTGIGLTEKTSTFCGSLEYMAPELLSGISSDASEGRRMSGRPWSYHPRTTRTRRPRRHVHSLIQIPR